MMYIRGQWIKKSTVKEAASELKVSKRTILREIKKGKIGVEKVGRKYLISEKSLNIYLNKDTLSVDKRLEIFFKKKKPEMINLLQKVVALPSVGYNSDQELQLANFIHKKMEEMGIRSVLLKEGRAVAVRGSYGYAEKGLVIDYPLDTAPIGDIDQWKYPPFGGVVKGGEMYGRGTADCKAGIVASIYTILALREFFDEEKIRVELVFDGGEQDGSYVGMEMVVKRGLYADAGIIGYAGDEFELAIGARGYHRYTFKTHGKSAHTGSRYNLGVNAIEKMAEFICRMKEVNLPKSKNKFFPFGQKMTFAIISGGIEINVVPDECTARLDVRISPDYSKEFVDGLINKEIMKFEKDDKDFRIEFKYDLGNEGYVVDDNQRIVSFVNESIYEVYGKKASIVATGPSNIGSILAREKIPAIVWGPRGGNVHSYNEYVEIDSIPETSLIYTKAILKYFGIG